MVCRKCNWVSLGVQERIFKFAAALQVVDDSEGNGTDTDQTSDNLGRTGRWKGCGTVAGNGYGRGILEVTIVGLNASRVRQDRTWLAVDAG